MRVQVLLGMPMCRLVWWLVQQGDKDMKNKAVKIGIIASIVPHIFCCGLPIAMSVAGLVAPEAAHIHIVPHWMEPWIFVFSGLILALSWTMVMRDCGCACDSCHGDHGHRVQKIILGVVTILFAASVILHLFAY